MLSQKKFIKSYNELEQKKDAFDIYKRYTWKIRDYKASDNQKEFKKTHLKEFMEWDSAKYDMRKLKEQYGIQSKEEKKMRVNYVKAYLMNLVDD